MGGFSAAYQNVKKIPLKCTRFGLSFLLRLTNIKGKESCLHAELSSTPLMHTPVGVQIRILLNSPLDKNVQLHVPITLPLYSLNIRVGGCQEQALKW
jgi:hypothetical protein